MDHKGLLSAFIDIFGNVFDIKSYKKIDSHSLEVFASNANTNGNPMYLIFTYYGPASFKLETR